MSKKVWLSTNAYDFVNKKAKAENTTPEQVVADLILRKLQHE
jgi:hypothetical protein